MAADVHVGLRDALAALKGHPDARARLVDRLTDIAPDMADATSRTNPPPPSPEDDALTEAVGRIERFLHGYRKRHSA
jgi:hypothetical protein